ncbi:MAG TPA: ASPIC/UnbV domain-containing protein, partial [Thermoanaerobaculia bacterium]
YWNAGDGRFRPLGPATGDLDRPLVARGAAYADLDGDGDLDVVIVENGGPARVYINRLDHPERSVRVRLVGAGRSNRDAVGARVTAVVGGRRQTQEVSGGQSYLSAPEKTLTFGLDGAAKIDSLEIRWPDGTRETRRDLARGAAVVIEEKAADSHR